jgi:hypothetical protein
LSKYLYEKYDFNENERKTETVYRTVSSDSNEKTEKHFFSFHEDLKSPVIYEDSEKEETTKVKQSQEDGFENFIR